MKDIKTRALQHEWKSHYFNPPQWFNRLPTMLTHQELLLLAWVTENAVADGEIVDLGCFLGGSTAALAFGNSRSKNPKKVFAYDRFVIDEKLKHLFLYSRGGEYLEGTDALPVFKKLLAPYKDNVQALKGDIHDFSFDKDISVLFLDLAKSLKTNRHVGHHFFSRLKPNSLIIQQDFIYFANPWLHLSMYLLRDKVELIGYAENYSALFIVNSKLTEEDIERAFPDKMNKKLTLESINYFKSMFPFARQKEMCDALLKSFEACNGADESFKYKNVSQIPITFGLQSK